MTENTPSDAMVEAMAWMYEYHPNPPETRRGAVEIRLDRTTYELGKRWTETPLYAHPPAAPDTVTLDRALVEEVRVALEESWAL